MKLSDTPSLETPYAWECELKLHTSSWKIVFSSSDSNEPTFKCFGTHSYDEAVRKPELDLKKTK